MPQSSCANNAVCVCERERDCVFVCLYAGDSLATQPYLTELS
jgi:hypothetical protein